VQASSSLFYEVFRKHDAGNLLLTQAETEALEQELEIGRLRETLERIATWELCITRPEHATPFSFPLMVERFREEVTTEKLNQRIERMLAELEAAAAEPTSAADDIATRQKKVRAPRLSGRATEASHARSEQAQSAPRSGRARRPT
jgi:Lhr-like helicase